MNTLTAGNFPKFASTVSTWVPETWVSTSQLQASSILWTQTVTIASRREVKPTVLSDKTIFITFFKLEYWV